MCCEQKPKVLQFARLPSPHYALCKVDEGRGLALSRSFGSSFSDSCQPELSKGGGCWQGGYELFGIGHLEVPFQRQIGPSAHGTPHAKDATGAPHERGSDYRDLMKRLYEPRHYYQRIRTFLERQKPSGPRLRLLRPDLEAFVKSLWLLWVWHGGRLAYWRLFVTTLLRHPRQFSKAMEPAITGDHFCRAASDL